MIPKWANTLLNPLEDEIAVILGTRRNEVMVRRGIASRKVDEARGDVRIHIDGARGEIAFCKIFNCYPDFDVAFQKGKIEVVLNGMKVDVVTRPAKYKNDLYLIRPNHKRTFDQDLFALMIEEHPSYWYVGYATSGELLRKENLKDWASRNRPGYSLHESKLHGELMQQEQRELGELIYP